MIRLGRYRDKTPALGALERDVLDVLWARGVDAASGTAKSVHDALSTQRSLTLSTVQSTLERLARKGLLTRTKHSRHYCYAPAIDRDELVGRMVADLAGELGGSNAAAALSGLINLDEAVDEATLTRLEDWIRQRRDTQRRGKQHGGGR